MLNINNKNDIPKMMQYHSNLDIEELNLENNLVRKKDK